MKLHDFIPNWLVDQKKPTPKNTTKLPEDAALPDIITKMLVDRGCTINKPGAEEVAQFFISSCLHIIDQHKADLEKIRRDIQDERSKWA